MCRYGVSTFRQVMDAILDEAEIEQYTIANEIEEKSGTSCSYQRKASEYYPNIILRAGVTFPA